jgi:hypothetical protein
MRSPSSEERSTIGILLGDPPCSKIVECR